MTKQKPISKIGCFQCSKRRIICDKTEPVCFKCHKKGIDCSGLGRVRFLDGLAQRRRIKGRSSPATDQPISTSHQETHSFPTMTSRIRWKSDQTPRFKRPKSQGPLPKKASDACHGQSSLSDEVHTEQGKVEHMQALDTHSTTQKVSWHSEFDLAENYEITQFASDSGIDAMFTESRLLSVTPWIDPLGSQTRMLLAHFSEQVAPVMVFFDTHPNGYRDILLPLACEDKLVQSAVCVVAAQHRSSQQPHLQAFADRGRSAIISWLISESSNQPVDQVFTVSTWATLIILLVGEAVTGSSEYTYLLQMLVCLAQNARESSSEVHDFLTKQTRLFEFLGQPLTSEQRGIDALRSPHERGLDFLSCDLPMGSPHSHTLNISRTAFVKASQIYLGRTSSIDDQWIEVEGLKQLVEQIKPEQEGSHVLVWVCFIGAADSTDSGHRSFFVDRLNRVFSQTGFKNIVAGLQYLPAIWSSQGLTRWTRTLAQLAPSLVM